MSCASSDPSRISSTLSQRAASSITWLETSSVIPLSGSPAEHRPQVLAEHRIEPDGGLVEEQQPRRAQQRNGQADPGALPAGQPPGQRAAPLPGPLP